MINYRKYRIQRPEYNIDGPITPYEPTDKNIQEWKDRWQAYKEECDTYPQRLAQYYIKVAELNVQYKIDVLNYLGLTNHPKAEEIWQLATDISNEVAATPDYTVDDVFSEYIEKLAKLVV